MGFFDKLKKITTNLFSGFTEADEAFFEELEETLILADLGAFTLAGKYAPHCQRHISTQQSVANHVCAQAWYDLGATRVVLARELSLEEIAAIRKAQSITDAAFLEILDFIKPGKTEKEVAAYLEYCMRRLGADGLAFETIAAGGPNSAKPHAVPGDRPLRQGDFFTMDYGAYWGGYCSDMTRTVAVGEPTEEMRRVYDTVLAAQLLGIEKAVVGASCRAVDAAARELIYNAGYEGCFGHSLGHSVGIEIHEMPGFSPSIAPETTAKEGMVITVEPGIYLEGRFGVRIEDMVWLAPDGTKDLTNSPKELIIL